MHLPIQALREAAGNMSSAAASKASKPKVQSGFSDVSHVAAAASHLVARMIPAQIVRERPKDGAHSAAALAGAAAANARCIRSGISLVAFALKRSDSRQGVLVALQSVLQLLRCPATANSLHQLLLHLRLPPFHPSLDLNPPRVNVHLLPLHPTVRRAPPPPIPPRSLSAEPLSFLLLLAGHSPVRPLRLHLESFLCAKAMRPHHHLPVSGKMAPCCLVNTPPTAVQGWRLSLMHLQLLRQL
jgi:hypothetical protein